MSRGRHRPPRRPWPLTRLALIGVLAIVVAWTALTACHTSTAPVPAGSQVGAVAGAYITHASRTGIRPPLQVGTP